MSSREPNHTEGDGTVQWTEEEQHELDKNMVEYPEDKFTELKRYTLLLTNLPHKRLRDVAARVKYMKYREVHPEMTWQAFCKDKSLIRPQRVVVTTKVPSRSSSQDSDVEGSSVKGKKPEETAMEIIKPDYDNVSGSLGGFEYQDPCTELPSIPSINTKAKPPKKKKAKVVKKAKEKVDKIKMEKFDEKKDEKNVEVKNEKMEEDGEHLPPPTNTLDLDSINSIMMNAETILEAMYQTELENGGLMVEHVVAFVSYVQQMLDFTAEITKPLELPCTIQTPFTAEDVQQLILNPQLIKMYEEQINTIQNDGSVQQVQSQKIEEEKHK
ncbi:hypothetical protein EIN_094150 [Entamoeba invadens IP1]|uniref:Uncharacterized protein n=1 Tax=Entamoeba invadens IP1 TaxID=370355 RepID=A0A0A1U3A1_ENTIV|nr:hypothetical protein EIN_094150 [Entamoeba invadens IP1]ELP87228.1 hypothetical protein EIN_094150 [Entamoeba invadens IP1]|eukprot:XP_004253999.1 hypothetical protein EIN_094150 [Entamoeba invadens IP1]